LAAQAFNEHARYIAATVAADIHHQCLLADLRIIKLDELADTVRAHVGMWMYPTRPLVALATASRL